MYVPLAVFILCFFLVTNIRIVMARNVAVDEFIPEPIVCAGRLVGWLVGRSVVRLGLNVPPAKKKNSDVRFSFRISVHCVYYVRRLDTESEKRSASEASGGRSRNGAVVGEICVYVW